MSKKKRKTKTPGIEIVNILDKCSEYILEAKEMDGDFAEDMLYVAQKLLKAEALLDVVQQRDNNYNYYDSSNIFDRWEELYNTYGNVEECANYISLVELYRPEEETDDEEDNGWKYKWEDDDEEPDVCPECGQEIID